MADFGKMLFLLLYLATTVAVVGLVVSALMRMARAQEAIVARLGSIENALRAQQRPPGA